jgi:hypothetical protein
MLGHEVRLIFQQLLSMTLPFGELKNDNSNDILEVNGQVAELHRSFPWASLKNGKVVDIGGGSGHISIGLARVFPSTILLVPATGGDLQLRRNSQVCASLYKMSQQRCCLKHKKILSLVLEVA